jgi:hypothetical protein
VSTIDLVRGRFQDDVRDHVLTVLHEDGLYRHLKFAKPGTFNMSFSIVTWPGRLCFCGDMGTFVFARIDDMLAFFRHDAPNYDYWAEKCEAHDRHNGVREYSQELFRRRARELIDETIADLDGATRAAVIESFEEDVLSRAENEHDARDALADFDAHGVSLSDTRELIFEEFTYRYVWCCQALVWAIKKYDAALVASSPAQEGTTHTQ